MKYLAFALSVLFLLSCGEKDPLKDYPDSVRNGRPAEKTAEDNRRLAKEVLLLRMLNDAPVFVEDEPQTVQFESRVLGEPNAEVRVDFTSLPEGATWHEDSLELRWTAPVNFLRGHEYQKTWTIKGKIATIYRGIPITIEENFILWIRRPNERQPVIQSITGLNTIAEGGSLNLQIKVLDPDSVGLTADDTVAPSLSLRPAAPGTSDASFLVSFRGTPVQSSSNPALWTFNGRVDTGDKELSASRTNYGFLLLANSRFGVPSDPYSARFSIKNRLSEPEHTWRSQVNFTPLQKSTYNFDVYLPGKDGEVTVQMNCNAAAGALCSCIRQEFTSRCKVIWTPEFGNYSGQIILSTRSVNPSDSTNVVLKDFSVSFSVYQ